jgi:hypothetical protein
VEDQLLVQECLLAREQYIDEPLGALMVKKRAIGKEISNKNITDCLEKISKQLKDKPFALHEVIAAEGDRELLFRGVLNSTLKIREEMEDVEKALLSAISCNHPPLSVIDTTIVAQNLFLNDDRFILNPEDNAFVTSEDTVANTKHHYYENNPDKQQAIEILSSKDILSPISPQDSLMIRDAKRSKQKTLNSNGLHITTSDQQERQRKKSKRTYQMLVSFKDNIQSVNSKCKIIPTDLERAS